MKKDIQKYIRVATLTNYNQTPEENQALKEWQRKHPNKKFFVNSHASDRITCTTAPSIITVNPNLTKFIKPKGKVKMIAAVRVKLILDPNTKVKESIEKSIKWAVDNEIKILITPMRFKHKELMVQCTTKQDRYNWTKNYFRASGEEIQKEIKKYTIPKKLLYLCDKNGTGCPDCQNCIRVAYNVKTPSPDTEEIYSLDLKESGHCKHNCPNCFVKLMTYSTNRAFDKLKKNSKQKGYSKK